MNNRIKYAAIIVGILSSSATMAAMSGTPVQGGEATVNMIGHITATSCSATIDATGQSFNLNRSDISKAVAGTNLAAPFSTLTLKDCGDVQLSAKVTASKRLDGDNMTGALEGDKANVLGYTVGFSGNGVTGGTGDNHNVPVDGSSVTSRLLITPDSGDYKLKMITYVNRVGSSEVPPDITALTGNYNYSITYF
ncbi:hypothetical protein C2478_20410 [Salmonella enterica]|nr:hypothetical protein [Salmonella enterica]ECC4608445.1 hypothetical protein [Salmonella enterica]ECJ1396102.1 hypothetical protein [Salmonella enterica]ECR4999311.1 hypothetical protein [Salmonella enterica]ECY1592232.1 hypothetical protein [Salmonella enterica]